MRIDKAFGFARKAWFLRVFCACKATSEGEAEKNKPPCVHIYSREKHAIAKHVKTNENNRKRTMSRIQSAKSIKGTADRVKSADNAKLRLRSPTKHDYNRPSTSITYKSFIKSSESVTK